MTSPSLRGKCAGLGDVTSWTAFQGQCCTAAETVAPRNSLRRLIEGFNLADSHQPKLPVVGAMRVTPHGTAVNLRRSCLCWWVSRWRKKKNLMESISSAKVERHLSQAECYFTWCHRYIHWCHCNVHSGRCRLIDTFQQHEILSYRRSDGTHCNSEARTTRHF